MATQNQFEAIDSSLGRSTPLSPFPVVGSVIMPDSYASQTTTESIVASSLADYPESYEALDNLSATTRLPTRSKSQSAGAATSLNRPARLHQVRTNTQRPKPKPQAAVHHTVAVKPQQRKLTGGRVSLASKVLDSGQATAKAAGTGAATVATNNWQFNQIWLTVLTVLAGIAFVTLIISAATTLTKL
jgi:hypothetical protein